ncbi:SPOR domain-containing protein [Thalassotalea ponticola]|uniref:SPOR domain-containing protein n=1 Tax=Thalassotalea ponticola TaxID=1523392 RepID=UPI0025B39A2D|nr:SPOR domain-containing protein [Thalassotalea ponticola]MDN3653750.1 SPOR domain-containing protein [Thalassotalea ponticola]
MAHQDYVARKPRAKKKTTTSTRNKKAKANQNPPKTKRYLFLIAAVSAVFAVGLKLMIDNAPQAPADDVTTVSKKASASNTNTSATAQESDIPPLPDDKWTYMEGLKDKKVEVGEYEVEQKGPYQMQCGSFRTKSQADTVKAKIAFAGYASDVRRTEGKNGVWYKVVLGPFERKRLAEKAKHTLRRSQINHCQIWLWT